MTERADFLWERHRREEIKSSSTEKRFNKEGEV